MYRIGVASGPGDGLKIRNQPTSSSSAPGTLGGKRASRFRASGQSWGEVPARESKLDSGDEFAVWGGDPGLP